MNRLMEKGFRPIDSLNDPDNGHRWSLSQKLLLGLSPRDYFRQVLRNPFNWVLFLIFAIGLPLIVYRYANGLGSVMHGSCDYPWGLFLGFGLFCMVPLSASGFLLGTAVELFGQKKFKPILNLALLNGLLGYFFAVVNLLVDLGCPWRLYYPMFVSWGTAAVLFLVGWHVATYLSVQIMEVSEAFFEWIGWPTAKKFIHAGTIGLTVAGIILSTLHQGALGTLLTYAPAKVHPLWYSQEFLWIFYLCSSVFAGLCMVIAVSTIVEKTMAWRCSRDFLDHLGSITIGLAKGATMALVTYFVIKLIGIAHDNEWSYLTTGWGSWFMLEIFLGVVLPIILFSVAIRKNSVGLVRFTAFLTIVGLIMNRLNTALISFNWNLYPEIPHPYELMITITIFTMFIAVYRFILYRLPILYSWKAAPEKVLVASPVKNRAPVFIEDSAEGAWARPSGRP
ncbi:MAG: polysulfide reductase NrfD [Deltaproteobacteria bacterium]|nr:polysulfide reductase NrfD [Candidatus Anaeroferrophillus wilburensis]MBN2889790.1 polysulfide reductase NrfD [Deltaproteobacteria bacterium]